MKSRYYAMGIVAALVMIGAAYAPAALGHANLWSQQNDREDKVADAPDDQDNETAEHQSEAAPVIAGGGWFDVKVGNMTFKDTFGLFISGNASFMNASSFVLQGRDLSTRIQSVNFTEVTFSNDNKTVDAVGWCTANGSTGYWFRITATDMGNRSADVLHLWVYKDSNKNWMMDEATPTWHWLVNGLGGGQISAGGFEEPSDDMDDDHDSDTDEEPDDD